MMRHEIIRHIELAAVDTFRKGMCHCDAVDGKLIFAEKIIAEAQKSIKAILDDKNG